MYITADADSKVVVAEGLDRGVRGIVEAHFFLSSLPCFSHHLISLVSPVTPPPWADTGPTPQEFLTEGRGFEPQVGFLYLEPQVGFLYQAPLRPSGSCQFIHFMLFI